MSTGIGIISETQQRIPLTGLWVGVGDVADIGRGGINREIAAELRQRIRELPPGTRLPSEGELATRHGVSRPTVRRALDELILEGLVVTRPQAGYFVREYDPQALAGDSDAELAAAISAGNVEPPARVAEVLPGERVVARRRAVRPGVVADSFYPLAVAAAVPELSMPGPLAQPDEELLAKACVRAAERSVDVYARSAGPEQSSLLDVPVGTALLEQVTVLRDAAGAVLVIRVAWMDGHRWSLRF